MNTEEFARQIRDELGTLNDDNEPVILLIRKLRTALQAEQSDAQRVVLETKIKALESALDIAQSEIKRLNYELLSAQTGIIHRAKE